MAQQKRTFDATRDLWESLSANANIIPTPSPGPVKKLPRSAHNFGRSPVRGIIQTSPKKADEAYPQVTTTSTTTTVVTEWVETVERARTAEIPPTDDYLAFSPKSVAEDIQPRVTYGSGDKGIKGESELSDDEFYSQQPDNRMSFTEENEENHDERSEVKENDEAEQEQSFTSAQSDQPEMEPSSMYVNYTETPMKESTESSFVTPVTSYVHEEQSAGSHSYEALAEPESGVVNNAAPKDDYTPLVAEPYTSDSAESVAVSALNFDDEVTPEPSTDPTIVALNKKIEELRENAAHYQSVVAQIRRSVTASNPANQSYMVEPRAEAELSVLTAVRKRKGCLAYTAELDAMLEQYKSGDKTVVTAVFQPPSQAILALSKMSFFMSPELVRTFEQDPSGDCFIVVIFSLKQEVYATERMPISEFQEDGMLFIRNMIRLHPTDCNFAVEVEAFLIRVLRPELLEDTKNGTPGFLKKILSVLPKSASRSDHSTTSKSLDHANVVNLGCMTLTIGNINDKQHRLYEGMTVQNCEVVLGMDADLDLEITTRHADFLTFHCYTDTGTDWIRRYCVLNGSVVSFWRYPDDENKKVPPLNRYDLKDCTDLCLSRATGDQCARPNSFIFKSRSAVFGGRKADSKDVEFEYSVAADGKSQLTDWLDKLNRVLKTINEWKVADDSS